MYTYVCTRLASYPSAKREAKEISQGKRIIDDTGNRPAKIYRTEERRTQKWT